MRIRASCGFCGRELLFFQLYGADAGGDRCPHCSSHFGIVGLRHLALAADRAVSELVDALEALAARRPALVVRPDTVLSRLEAAVDALAHQAADENGRAEERGPAPPLEHVA